MSKVRAQSIGVVAVFCLFILAVVMEPALAAGGLEKVEGFMDNILKVMTGVSLVIVTIALIWAGYKFLFKHADIMEAAKILGGGLLIGGAAEIAGYLLAK